MQKGPDSKVWQLRVCRVCCLCHFLCCCLLFTHDHILKICLHCCLYISFYIYPPHFTYSLTVQNFLPCNFTIYFQTAFQNSWRSLHPTSITTEDVSPHPFQTSCPLLIFAILIVIKWHLLVSILYFSYSLVFLWSVLPEFCLY